MATVSPVWAASTADWIDVYCAVGQSLRSSSTVSVAAWADDASSSEPTDAARAGVVLRKVERFLRDPPRESFAPVRGGTLTAGPAPDNRPAGEPFCCAVDR